MEWLGALDASFEAALARDEDVAAADLAFSLRQDTTAREAVARSRTGWRLVLGGETSPEVDEVGADYARAGSVLVPLTRAVLRSSGGQPPRLTEVALPEILGRACREGSTIEVTSTAGTVSGRLVRAARDHLALLYRGAETVIALGMVERIRVGGRSGYSASRGFSG